MKRDCGGAAGILGAFFLAVKQGFSQNLHAVFCLAENAVSDRATRPDDIHTLYSGKTVEINNTDAEGRLVLSDGVFYARKDLKVCLLSILFEKQTLLELRKYKNGLVSVKHMFVLKLPPFPPHLHGKGKRAANSKQTCVSQKRICS